MLPEFGTNTGRQGIFDPDDPQQYQNALERLKMLHTQYGPAKLSGHFTGDTGLATGDIDGYAQWQNAMTEAKNIQRIFSGQSPMNIELGQEKVVGNPALAALHGAGQVTSDLPRAKRRPYEAPMPESQDDWMKRYGYTPSDPSSY